MQQYSFVITVSSEKGGVGKTTLATNLAIYLSAMRENLPVTIFSFDNHFTIDHMFEFKGQKTKGTVHDLLMGESAANLLHTGQYGVNYIPSSNDLNNTQEHFKGPMTLTRMLAESGLSGIVIIDTRPDLNILTQNALYAADRVLIPVKDMPSLENCKNIFALFDQYGIDKKSLTLIPCLVDERIKFDGIFKDQKTLLRAFAANRGYRCMDTFISKSPKVESLNTNPDGKIYPILTHARGTDVYSQFAEITQELLQNMDNTPEPRSCLYAQWLSEKEGKRKESFMARLEGLADRCLICGTLHDQKPQDRGFYFETSDRVARGFLHSECFANMICSAFYGLEKGSDAHEAAQSVIAEKASSTVSLFYTRETDHQCSLDFRQFDHTGQQLMQRNISLKGFAEGEFDALNAPLFMLLNETLAGYEGKLREGSWLAVHPIDPQNPESVLHEEHYRSIQQTQARIGMKMLSVMSY